MDLSNLKPAEGATKTDKRIGRGQGSGRGGTSTRGHKGAKSRSGYKHKRGFEGGQLPIIKRLPRKRGFFNLFRVSYSPVNVGSLCMFAAGTEVTPELLFKSGLIESLVKPVKVLADGEIKTAIIVKASKFSASAKAKIEAAGGKVEEI